MEYKIGQVFEVKGKWYQFVETNRTCCDNCVFNQGLKCRHPDISMQCARFFRTDGKNGHVVLLDAIGGEYKQGNAIFRDYRCQTKPVTADRRVYINNSDSDISLIISIKIYDLVEKFEQNKEDMKTVKISKDDLNFLVNKIRYGILPKYVDNDKIINEVSKLFSVDDTKHSNSENGGKNLKEFNLETAKSGKPVCARDGRKARIICFDRVTNSTNNEYTGSLVVLITNPNGDEQSWYYTDKGILAGRDEYDNHKYDLMMLPEKKEGWVNLYRDEESKRVYCGEFIFSEREKAEKHYECNDTKVATVPVNWEE